MEFSTLFQDECLCKHTVFPMVVCAKRNIDAPFLQGTQFSLSSSSYTRKSINFIRNINVNK